MLLAASLRPSRSARLLSRPLLLLLLSSLTLTQTLQSPPFASYPRPRNIFPQPPPLPRPRLPAGPDRSPYVPSDAAHAGGIGELGVQHVQVLRADVGDVVQVLLGTVDAEEPLRRARWNGRPSSVQAQFSGHWHGALRRALQVPRPKEAMVNILCVLRTYLCERKGYEELYIIGNEEFPQVCLFD